MPSPSPMNKTSMHSANGSGLMNIADPPAVIIGNEASRSSRSMGMPKYFKAKTVLR